MIGYSIVKVQIGQVSALSRCGKAPLPLYVLVHTMASRSNPQSKLFQHFILGQVALDLSHHLAHRRLGYAWPGYNVGHGIAHTYVLCVNLLPQRREAFHALV